MLFPHLFLQELIYCPHVSRFNNCLKLSLQCVDLLTSTFTYTPYHLLKLLKSLCFILFVENSNIYITRINN